LDFLDANTSNVDFNTGQITNNIKAEAVVVNTTLDYARHINAQVFYGSQSARQSYVHGKPLTIITCWGSNSGAGQAEESEEVAQLHDSMVLRSPK
jgi:hypothetical protein